MSSTVKEKQPTLRHSFLELQDDEDKMKTFRKSQEVAGSSICNSITRS
jgi:hypothetical protein